jgi:hypothetical protein
MKINPIFTFEINPVIYFKIGGKTFDGTEFSINDGKTFVNVSALEDLIYLFKLNWIKSIEPFKRLDGISDNMLKDMSNNMSEDMFYVVLIDGLKVKSRYMSEYRRNKCKNKNRKNRVNIK